MLVKYFFKSVVRYSNIGFKISLCYLSLSVCHIQQCFKKVLSIASKYLYKQCSGFFIYSKKTYSIT